MQVFLIRHTRPQLAAGICYGQLDVACEDPLPVARQLRAQIPCDTPIFCSPLKRARVLAEALGKPYGMTPCIDARLSEISFGAWEGKPWEDIDRAALDMWAADVLHFVPPGGESVAQLRARVIAFAETLRLPRLAIVAHAGVMKTLCGYWQKLPSEDWTQLEFSFGGLVELTV